MMLKENTTLFDSMVKQLDLFPDLRDMIKDILYQGKKIPFSPLVKSMNEEQLTEYLEYFCLKKGYMLSFNFNKKKKVGIETIEVRDMQIVEAVV